MNISIGHKSSLVHYSSYKYEDDSNEKFLVTYLLLAAASSISKIPKILLDLNEFR